MAAKPTQDPKWVASDNPNEIIEPTPALKNNGILSGGVWGREHLNWMFNAVSKWIDWIRSYAMDKSLNLSDVDSAPISFNNIKQSATTTSTGVVEEATSTEMENGTGGKFPDCETVKTWIEGVFQQTTTINLNGDFTSGTCKINRVGNTVTLELKGAGHLPNSAPATSGPFIPSWALPSQQTANSSSYPIGGYISTLEVNTGGKIIIRYSDSDLNYVDRSFTSGTISISYIV